MEASPYLDLLPGKFFEPVGLATTAMQQEQPDWSELFLDVGQLG
jgi:hypothetical protein